MSFDVTPEEAQPCASRLLAWLQGRGEKVTIEKSAWDDAPYRTTLFMRSGSDIILYEVQGHLNFHDRLGNFAQWLRANRHSAELNLVTEGESMTMAGQLSQLKKNGVGLLLLNDSQNFEVFLQAKNPALQVNPDPALKYGKLIHEVGACITKFNEGARKDGVRDLCELVERETERLLVTAARKGVITLTEPVIRTKDWSDQINSLASTNILASGGTKPVIDAKLKDDLHSFRGARNLIDHQARSKREEQRRQRQFAERMMMGARLISDLVSHKRKME